MVGDISAIDRAERRRSDFTRTHQPTAAKSEMQLLVDRYQFLDCLPCPAFHLHAINAAQQLKHDSAAASFDSRPKSTNKRGLTPSEAKKMKSRWPRPNVGKMTVYKPGMTVKGSFGKSNAKKYPDKIQALLNKLPSASQYTGKKVAKVDQLISLIVALPVPPLEGPSPLELAITLGYADPGTQLQSGYKGHMANKVGGPGMKPKSAGPGSDLVPGEGMLQRSLSMDVHEPPANDIYRRRQRQQNLRN